MRRLYTGLALGIFAVGGGCGGGSSLQMTGSVGCPPGDGTVETWCDTVGNCEIRVVDGPFYRCNTSDANSCLRATEQAAEACRSQVSADGGTGDGSVGNDGEITIPDAGPCPGLVDEVDLLLMVDNSNSMSEEQALLTSELPRFVYMLASGDADGDGDQEFQPVRSLHIGVVTSDMGVGGFTIPSCEAPMGDDGRLLNMHRGSDPACTGPYPSIFEFQRGIDGPTEFAQQVGCVARTGTSGCGFEQQLDAVLKAISPSYPQDWTIPSYVPPEFFNRTSGHADLANAGFVRPNSALAIIMVTDEEDCSAADPDLFNPDSITYGGAPLNLRCSIYDEARHPIARYIRGADGQSGLLGLRRHPNRLIFAGIVGVPVESVPDPSAIDYAAILNHPLMQEGTDPSSPERLIPSCNTARGLAFPPRRIVRVAQGIEAAGGRATIQSICHADFTGALEAIVRETVPALEGTCSTREP